jgi:hypothetical protein
MVQEEEIALSPSKLELTPFPLKQGMFILQYIYTYNIHNNFVIFACHYETL